MDLTIARLFRFFLESGLIEQSCLKWVERFVIKRILIRVHGDNLNEYVEVGLVSMFNNVLTLPVLKFIEETYI